MPQTLRALGIGRSLFPEIPDFDRDVFTKYAPSRQHSRHSALIPPVPPCRSILVSLLFVGNVASAFIGLRIVDVPLFLCVRRLTTLCVLGAEYILLGKIAPPNIRCVHCAVPFPLGCNAV